MTRALPSLGPLPGRCNFEWAAAWSRNANRIVDHLCSEWDGHDGQHLCLCGDTSDPQ